VPIGPSGSGGVVKPPPLRACHGIRRFTSCTDRVIATKPNVAGEMFLAMTRTVSPEEMQAVGGGRNRQDRQEACQAARENERSKAEVGQPALASAAEGGSISTGCPCCPDG